MSSHNCDFCKTEFESIHDLSFHQKSLICKDEKTSDNKDDNTNDKKKISKLLNKDEKVKINNDEAINKHTAIVNNINLLVDNYSDDKREELKKEIGRMTDNYKAMHKFNNSLFKLCIIYRRFNEKIRDKYIDIIIDWISRKSNFDKDELTHILKDCPATEEDFESAIDEYYKKSEEDDDTGFKRIFDMLNQNVYDVIMNISK